MPNSISSAYHQSPDGLVRLAGAAETRSYPSRCGPALPVPASSCPHVAYRDEPEDDLMELNGWTASQMLRRHGTSARNARARRTCDRT